MGLDMYLTKKIFIGAEYEHCKVKGKIEITTNDKPVKINFNKVSYIEESVSYWRKANAIHRWFVDNCQDGNDDCRTAYVSTEELQKLLSICKKIKENPKLAKKLLPPQEGFFFGSTKIDEGYFQDIDSTIEIIESILLEDKETVGDFYYHSSW
jgi:hypothetical protein